MILTEAIVGGVLYLEYDAAEMALPPEKRVTFHYHALTNREKVKLLHRTTNENGRPNGADVCLVAVDRVDNLMQKDGKTPLDTVQKMLDYQSSGTAIAYMLLINGGKIWDRQDGEADSKNSE